MKVLITGGTGFIGGRLADHFLGLGHQVVIGSRNKDGIQEKFPGVQVIQTDWNQPSKFMGYCHNIDVLIHAAGVNAQDAALNPKEAIEFHGNVTSKLIKAAHIQGVKKLIYISTAHVYKNPLIGSFTEEAPVENLHPYAVSHVLSEKVVLKEAVLGSGDSVVVRLSNAFGAPFDKDINCWKLLINDLCKQVIINKRMILHSSGTQLRDFIPITDVCRAISFLAFKEKKSPNAEIYNLGSGQSMSVAAVAKIIQLRCIETLGFKPFIEFAKVDPERDQRCLHFNVDKIARNGYFAETKMEYEIDKLLIFCRLNYE